MLSTAFLIDRIGALYSLAAQTPKQRFEEEFCRQVCEDFSLAYCAWWYRDRPGAERLLAKKAAAPGCEEQQCTVTLDNKASHRLIFGTHKTSFVMEPTVWQALAEGMVAARRNALALVESKLAEAPADTGVAWLDTDGKLHRSCSVFRKHIQSQWPSWDGCSLPFSIPAAPAKGFVWQKLYIRILRLDDGVRLAVHRDRRASNAHPLSPRELEVAHCVAKGYSFKQVGRELDISPSTAASHLYKAYDKIGVRGRSALVDWLSTRQDSVA